MPHKNLLNSTSQIVALVICLIGTGMFLFGNAAKLKKNIATVSLQSASKQKSDKIDKVAAEISVKILDQDFLGSGFIVQQQGDRYTVVTNQHVLRAGESPYRIQTPDGKIHSAVVADSLKSDYEYDLALLEFRSNNQYSTAKIGSSVFLEVGEPIFAVGFPYSDTKAQSRKIKSGLAIKTGRVAVILNQALVEGYQIAYTNDVKKGMSGGALFNSRGEVVGVNGKHAYPLWESPELYQDGSQPCPELEQLITRSSLAIPIEKSIELNPQLDLRAKFDLDEIRTSNLLSQNPQLVAQMQAEAEATAKSCENYHYDGE